MPIRIFKNEFRGFDQEIVRSDSRLSYRDSNCRDEIRRLLDIDFMGKCAYCGWDRKLAGFGCATFHIDHFDSRLKGTEKDVYSAYVYACPICNTTKNRKEICIDPISREYSKMFKRNRIGAILISDAIDEDSKQQAEQIYSTLKLYKEIYKLDYLFMSCKIVKSKLKLMKENNREIAQDYDQLDAIIEVFNQLIVRKSDPYQFMD